jgi:folate-binding protein YgfZ
MCAADVWETWLGVEEIVPAGRLALNWLRTEAGIPWYGLDMGPNSLPMEFGLDSAVSLDKGCYRGQEIVARIAYRGRLGRSLAGVLLDCDVIPQPGTEIRAGDAKAGRITSAIISPSAGKPLALAVLKTVYLEPGTNLEVAGSEAAYPAQVVKLPLPRDPGHENHEI